LPSEIKFEPANTTSEVRKWDSLEPAIMAVAEKSGGTG